MASPLRSTRRNQRSPLTTLSSRLEDSDNNMQHLDMLTPSPEEQIIRQRSRRAAAQIANEYIRANSSDLVSEDNEFNITPEYHDKAVSKFETPPETPRSPRKKILSPKKVFLTRKMSPARSPAKNPKKSPEKSPAKKQRVQRKKLVVPIGTELKALSTGQLVGIIEDVMQRHPFLEQEIRELIPVPDITPLTDQLFNLQRNIFKSFPYTRWGSSRDAFCYRRVRTHLEAFKKACIEQAKNLLTSQTYEALMEYCLAAWKYITQMPQWDNESHNKSKEQCFKQIASCCMQAVKKGAFEKEKLYHFQERLSEAVEDDSGIEPCLTECNKILQKLH